MHRRYKERSFGFFSSKGVVYFMPKVSEEHRVARKKQIVEAATICFSNKGLHHSTMSDICREANLSAGAVYGYFAGKDDLIKAITEETYRENTVAVAQIEKSEDDPFATLNAFADHFFGQIECCPVAIDIELWSESLRSSKVKRILRNNLDLHIKIFVEFIQKGQVSGDFNKEVSPEALIRVVTAIYQGLMVQKAIQGSIDIESVIKEIKMMLKKHLAVDGQKTP